MDRIRQALDKARAERRGAVAARPAAGVAAAVSGALSSLMAVILGGLAARYYDGTMTPIALAFVVFGALAWLASEWAEAGRRRLVTKTTL